MTELEAMNMLLRLVGSSPVNTINSTHPDAANALTVLSRVRKQVQRRGWWFNLDYWRTLPLNSSNEIDVATDIASIVMEDPNIVLRGNKLYDKYNNTYTFSEAETAHSTSRELEWDDMPYSVQVYCAYTAGAQFIRDELEDTNKARELQQEAANAMMDVKREDLAAGQYNIFNRSRVVRARGGVRPYSRGNTRFYGSPDA